MEGSRSFTTSCLTLAEREKSMMDNSNTIYAREMKILPTDVDTFFFFFFFLESLAIYIHTGAINAQHQTSQRILPPRSTVSYHHHHHSRDSPMRTLSQVNIPLQSYKPTLFSCFSCPPHPPPHPRKRSTYTYTHSHIRISLMLVLID